MKTKLFLHYLQSLKWLVIRPAIAGFLLILALSPEPCALSQIPQGFNYQAIARDPSNGNNPITGATMQVKIGILSDTIANTMVWEELFNPVKTNAFGMFNIVVGTGVKQSGSATTFNAIYWTKTPLFLRTTIYYQSAWKVMGTTKLQSVPYSMVAGNLEGTVPYVGVAGNTSAQDSALFVVRNNTGQIVFAVYNEGVRIYVSDTLSSKGRAKGGFAIGSFDKSKGTSQPLFIVDPDSIRAYLDNNPVKAVKGGFAIGGFDKSKSANQNFLMVSKDSIRMYIDDNLITKSTTKGGFAIGSFDKSKGGNVNYFNVSPDSVGRIYPSQNRILWYPLKDALLEGKVIAENKDSVGTYSFASGYESRAKGKYSQALGYKAIARGDYSTAIGKNAIADSTNSFAFGNGATVQNNDSYSFGAGAIATGIGSYAIGSAGRDSLGNLTGNMTSALGNYSFALGQGSRAKGLLAFAFGANVLASGTSSTAMGYSTTASGIYSTAMGLQTTASGLGSTSMGLYSTASEFASVSLGYYANSFSIGSTSIGYVTTASGKYSIAMGYKTTASGLGSTAIGYSTIANGGNSTSIGDNTIASGILSTAMGGYTVASGDHSTSIGYSTTASGNISTAMGFDNTASGTLSTALGSGTIALSGWETAVGSYNTSYIPLSVTGWNASDRLFVIGNGNDGLHQSDAVTVLKNGNIGIGTSTPQATLEINGGSGDRLAFWRGADNTLEVQTLLDGVALSSYPYGGDTENRLILQPKVGNVGVGTTTPGYRLQVGNAGDGSQARANAWNLLSDIRLKTNFTDINDPLGIVSNLKGFYFNWNTGIDKSRQVGLSAQEVEKVLPEIVSKGDDGYLSVEYSKLAPVLVEAIKVQQHQIANQQQQIESTKKENQQLKSELDELKTLVNTLVANQTGQGNK